MGEFSREVQEILDRVKGAPAGPPSWTVAQRQSREGFRRRSELEQERALVLDQLDRAERSESSAMFAEARRRLLKRLDNGWSGSGHQITQRRKFHFPVDRSSGSTPTLKVDPVERYLMRILALTTPARQYGVSSHSLVFTTSANGWSRDPERVWLSGLSPLIDDVGQFYAEWRKAHDGHLGGRFFERDGSVFNASDHQTLLRLIDQ